MTAANESALTRWLAPQVAEFSPGLLAIQDSPPPKLPRAVFYTVGVLFAVLLSWALLAKLDVVAVAEGKLVPATYTKIVQPAEAGIVKEVLVGEGDQVAQGQVLIQLDPTLAGADSTSLAGELALKRLALRRIDAELRGSDLTAQPGDDPALFAQVQSQALAHRQAYTDALAQETAVRQRSAHELESARQTLAKLRTTLPLAEQSAAAHARLVADGFFSPIAASEKQREAIQNAHDLKAQTATAQSLEAMVAAQDKKMAALTSNYRSQLQGERTEVLGQLAKLEQEHRKLGFKAGLLELRAPQAGVVKDVATTTVGAVVQPGMVLMTLVPKDEELLAEVQIRNEDVGFVRAGQAVKLKVAAFPFQKYGLIEGRVQTIAPDAQSNASNAHQPGPLGYKALIKLDGQALDVVGPYTADGERSGRHSLDTGMQVAAEIHQGRRTVMEYLLSPVQKTVHDAGRER